MVVDLKEISFVARISPVRKGLVGAREVKAWINKRRTREKSKKQCQLGPKDTRQSPF
jgi:hypothetical protein